MMLLCSQLSSGGEGTCGAYRYIAYIQNYTNKFLLLMEIRSVDFSSFQTRLRLLLSSVA